MTNPVILLGTQSNGETLPVQVDATGRLVAEGLQGPEGPDGQEGPPGPPGPGVPYPWGDEGQIIQIVNGEPTWVDYQPPEPPGPSSVAITSQSPDEIGDFGMFSDAGAQQPDGTDWNVFAPTQNFWTTPVTANIAGAGRKGWEFIEQEFTFTAAFGEVFRLGFACFFKYKGNNPAVTTWTCTTQSQGFVSINDSFTFNMPGGQAEHRVSGEFLFLVNRDITEPVTFRIQQSGPYLQNNSPYWQAVQHWTLVDSGTYAVMKQAENEKRLNSIREALVLSKLVSTPDIDVLRSD